MKKPYSKNTFSMRIGKWCHVRELRLRIWLTEIEEAYWDWRISVTQRKIDKLNVELSGFVSETSTDIAADDE